MDKLTVRGGGGIVLGKREPASITGESCLGSGLGKVRCTDFVQSDAIGFDNVKGEELCHARTAQQVAWLLIVYLYFRG